MGEYRNVTANLAKHCDSCKSATASLFCRNDAAFLCIPCDSNIHAANKVASRHARVWMCEVCEQAPAHVSCKADAAALCISCDRDIHSANPLACRHERFPVVPFYDGVVRGGEGRGYVDEEEWLMPNLNAKIEDVDVNLGKVNFDSYLDLVFCGKERDVNEEESDGVVPEHCKGNDARMNIGSGGVDEDCFDVDFVEPVKGFPYFGAANVNSLNHSVSSQSLCSHFNDIILIQVSFSSHENGVVPDAGVMIDVSNTFGRQNSSVGEAAAQAVPLFGVEREAKVLRYKEKRKNRKFEKTIRYASRKAYAETRPRIKGRFAKRMENDAMNSPAIANGVTGYGEVPSYLLNASN